MNRRFVLAMVMPLALQLPAFAWDADDIAEIIRETEIKGPSIKNLSEKKVKAIAMCSLEVEAKREKYARALDMFLEGVGADKDVDSAKVEYEKAQVNLASQWNKAHEVLPILKKQEVLAQKWKAERVAKNKELAKACERHEDAKVTALSPKHDTHPNHGEDNTPRQVLSQAQPKDNPGNQQPKDPTPNQQPKDNPGNRQPKDPTGNQQPKDNPGDQQPKDPTPNQQPKDINSGVPREGL